MVMVWVPSATLLPTVTVIVDFPVPGAGMGFGLKVVGAPAPDKVIAESKPLAALAKIVVVPELPLATVIELGDAAILKVGVVAEVTVRVTVVVCVTPPPVPVTVIV
jgi:hypothetical protein